jgi:predicted DsbA family dithiol-disulfide isomerase
MPVIHASYYTDPACAASWGAEPALRRLLVEFGESLRITYVMAGLAREFSSPADMVGPWLDVADRTGMPVDPRLWLAAPPRSSYPAGMAVKGAAEQGDPAPYLRRLREGLMCGRRRLDHAEAFMGEARETPGLDPERFAVDLGSHAIVEAFGADLERARERGADVDLPVLEVEGRLVRDPGAWREVVAGAGGERAGDGPPSVEDALRRFGRMATVEVAEVCGLPGPRASAELWRLAEEWRVRPERRLTGELWALA